MEKSEPVRIEVELTDPERECSSEQAKAAGGAPAVFMRTMIQRTIENENRVREIGEAAAALQKAADSLYIIALNQEETGSADMESIWKLTEEVRQAARKVLSGLYGWQ